LKPFSILLLGVQNNLPSLGAIFENQVKDDDLLTGEPMDALTAATEVR
jgi:hypothetical protein